ncbi:glycosyltransferase family 2 protein [Zavarzinia sp.]|uniref:glycosyltransferase family 2 protein n=1 Tax=Zavarzinia sp. TaxID=2027920 RepID=UPI003BB51F70
MLDCSVKCILNNFVIVVHSLGGGNLLQMKIRDRYGRIFCSYGSDEQLDPSNCLQIHPCGRAFDKQRVSYYFVADTIIDPYFISMVESVQLEAEIQFDQEEGVVQFRVERTSIDEFGNLTQSVQRRLAQMQRTGKLFSALVAGGLRSVEGESVFIEYAYQMNRVLFVNGWLPNFGSLEVYMLSDDGAHVAAQEDMIPQNRIAVSEYLAGQGKVQPSTDAHGFCAVLPKSDMEGPLIVGVLRGTEFYVLYAAKPELAPSADRIFPMVLGAWQMTLDAPLSKGVRMMMPFIQKNLPRSEYSTPFRSHFSATQPATVSVIVPFYKEWRLLYSILVMARRSPDDWEWVIVCDDPGIAQFMRRLIAGTPPGSAGKITFVVMKYNIGYGPANNVGVKMASSDNILLMNSDVWMSEFSAIQDGLRALAEGAYALLGFTLLFEDGTVQHDGLGFRRSQDVDMMYLVLHPGKGLPPALLGDEIEIAPAGAVTGALMLVTRQEFLEHGGFNDRYIGGDFEDADLCLTLIRGGRRVGIVRSRQIFHLERQSIRKDAANNVGFARTLVNCDRFNRRWGSHLDGIPQNSAQVVE